MTGSGRGDRETAAVEAAAKALAEDDGSPGLALDEWAEEARIALTAARPHLRAEVAAEIAEALHECANGGQSHEWRHWFHVAAGFIEQRFVSVRPDNDGGEGECNVSGRSPWWRFWLQRHMPCLFRVCSTGNYHWRTDKLCRCSGEGAVALSVPGALTERRHRLGATRRDDRRCRREGHLPSRNISVALDNGRYVPVCQRCGYGVESRV